MTHYKIRITRQARANLIAIRDHISNVLFQPVVAGKVIRFLKAKMASLSEMPERIKTIDEEPWGSSGFRKIRAKNYYIYFWISEEKKQVQIIAVTYVHMDQIRLLEHMFSNI